MQIQLNFISRTARQNEGAPLLFDASSPATFASWVWDSWESDLRGVEYQGRGL